MARTIVAIATPPGAGGIGVIRLSGEDAFSIADRVFTAKSGRTLASAKGYTAHYGTVHDANGERLDDAVVTVFRAPRSFTGESVVEFSCHGGVYLLRRVLAAVLAAGASPAGPGEFTRRAFENGKMDLAQAEAVMGLIGAGGEQALRAARAGQDGVLSRTIGKIREELVLLAGDLAAWADYPDDDIPQVNENKLKTGLGEAKIALKKLLDSFEAGRILREGVDTVIAGRPNAGKSTLMNLLAGCERSIVTDIAGTTRDVVEETVMLGDVPLRLADTAGIRQTDDPVEQIGVSRALGRVGSAQLVFAVFDSSQPLNDDDRRLTEALGDVPCVAVINKTDLPAAADEDYLRAHFPRIVYLSAKTGEGFEELKKTTRELLGTAQLDPAAGILYTERQRDDVRRALEAVEEADSALWMGMTLDAVTVSLEGALSALFELTGERVSDAVVDSVFERFCVGK